MRTVVVFFEIFLLFPLVCSCGWSQKFPRSDAAFDLWQQSPQSNNSLGQLPECQTIYSTSDTVFQKCRIRALQAEPAHEQGYEKIYPRERDVSINFLQLTGSFEETARTHAFLLADQMSTGLISYVKSTKQRFLETLPEGQRFIYTRVLNCLVGQMKNSADPEYLRMHHNLALGLQDAGHTEYSENDVLEMSFSTELSVIVSGLQRKLRRTPVQGYAEILARCGTELLGIGFRARSDLFELFNREDLSDAFFQMGCTGAAVTGELSSSGSLWMSRNLDGSALGYFDLHPTVILHDPVSNYRDKGDHHIAKPEKLHRYVGIASAGLHYVGGNSGFNDAGIGVTLHEMETEQYRTDFSENNGLTAVYLQNRILERAGSIDEAWEVFKKSGNYTAWTIVVGDGKTGEIAAFEFSGKKAVLAKRIQNGFHAQTNHFQHPAMRDQFYNYSFNKVLESRFRIQRVDDLVSNAADRIGAQWLINLLSDHFDLRQGLRSFGRNVIKTNTMTTQVFQPSSGKMITSISDRYPVGQGRFLEFDVDFNKHARGENPFKMVAMRSSENPFNADKNSWRASLGTYVESYIKYKAQTGNLDNLLEAHKLIEAAIAQAEADKVNEFTYWFIKGKLELKMAALYSKKKEKPVAQEWAMKSRETFAFIDSAIVSPDAERFHPYDRAMAQVWQGRSRLVELALVGPAIASVHADNADVAQGRQKALEEFNRARDLIEPLLAFEKQDFELRQFLVSFSPSPGKLKDFSLKEAAEMNIDFVTVE